MDSSVSKAVDAYVDNLVATDSTDGSGTNRPEELDVDALFDQLENEDDGVLRERRLAQLHGEINKINELKGKEHGEYTEIKNEKAVLDLTTTTSHVVAHFFHKNFRRCQIVDTHLETLAKKHYQTKFIKVDVENVPFLVISLKIQVLPCIIAFIDGIGVDRIIGFEDLGNTDTFSTARLEYRLIETGVISRPRIKGAGQGRSIFGFKEQKNGESSDEETDND